MKYGVIASGKTQNETDDFGEAQSIAVALSKWNIECQIIDIETGETLKYFTPYHKIA